MSHFSCAVITNEEVDVDGLLAPYSEEIVVAPYIRTSKKELIKEYEKMMDEAKNKPESYASQMQKRDNILGMSQEKFSRHYHGSDAVFDIGGNLITTYNPRTEWSWYVIGGRWKNLLPMKKIFGGGKTDMGHIAEIDWEALRMNGDFYTYAVVTPDGMWYAVGKMGMWGSSSEEPKDVKEWAEKWYDRFVKPFIQLKEDHFITIVDCHQ